jgi:HAD superfamily hydrolase (TIGR01509 family)
MLLKSLIFDFDGLILDTETPEFQAWQDIYQEHGHELPAEEWLGIVGGDGLSGFDAASHLVSLVDNQPDAAALRRRHRAESDARIASQPILPGVNALLLQARKAGLKLAIASSSSHSWVDSHLSRLGMLDKFDSIICSDDVPPGRTKPNPDLFLKALEALNVRPAEAIVFEDSLNGIRAAKAAGIFVVAVPNHVTGLFGVDGADLLLDSLRDFRLERFLQLK